MSLLKAVLVPVLSATLPLVLAPLAATTATIAAAATTTTTTTTLSRFTKLGLWPAAARQLTHQLLLGTMLHFLHPVSDILVLFVVVARLLRDAKISVFARI